MSELTKLETLEQLTIDDAFTLIDENEWGLLKMYKQEIHNHIKAGHKFDLPTIQFYFYQKTYDYNNIRSLPF